MFVAVARSAKAFVPDRSVRCRAVNRDFTFYDRAAAGCVAGLLALGCHVVPVSASLTDTLSSENAIFDAAKVIPSDNREQTNESLLEFEKRTGWRIRVLSLFGDRRGVSEDEIRDQWKPDDRTVVIAFDPSSPNIVAFRYIGDSVQEKLKRPFWVELQSRFGNIFFVRQEGEGKAVEEILSSVEECLERVDGCRVVPGLASEEFVATLLVSIAGGLVLGFSSKIDDEGEFSRRVVWILAFSPLWLVLFVNFGIGPIVSRTLDRLPVAANTAAFLFTALVFQLIDFPPKWMKGDITGE